MFLLINVSLIIGKRLLSLFNNQGGRRAYFNEYKADFLWGCQTLNINSFKKSNNIFFFNKYNWFLSLLKLFIKLIHY